MAGAPVTAVVRGPDKLDIFVVGTDNHVYTAAWRPDSGGWQGWWRIGDISVPHRTPVHAVSRSADKLDIFVTDVSGRVMSAAWEPAFTDGWHGWWHINGGLGAPGAPVTAVVRGPNKLDIFVVGTDGRAYTAAWRPDSGGWQGWWTIGTARFPARRDQRRVAQQRQARHLRHRERWRDADRGVGAGEHRRLARLVADPRRPRTTRCSDPRRVALGEQTRRLRHRHRWLHLHRRVGTRIHRRLARLVAAQWRPCDARRTGHRGVAATNKLDVFVVGTDSRIYTAAWRPDSGGWQGWWPMGA